MVAQELLDDQLCGVVALPAVLCGWHHGADVAAWARDVPRAVYAPMSEVAEVLPAFRGAGVVVVRHAWAH